MSLRGQCVFTTWPLGEPKDLSASYSVGVGPNVRRLQIGESYLGDRNGRSASPAGPQLSQPVRQYRRVWKVSIRKMHIMRM